MKFLFKVLVKHVNDAGRRTITIVSFSSEKARGVFNLRITLLERSIYRCDYDVVYKHTNVISRREVVI